MHQPVAPHQRLHRWHEHRRRGPGQRGRRQAEADADGVAFHLEGVGGQRIFNREHVRAVRAGRAAEGEVHPSGLEVEREALQVADRDRRVVQRQAIDARLKSPSIRKQDVRPIGVSKLHVGQGPWVRLDVEFQLGRVQLQRTLLDARKIPASASEHFNGAAKRHHIVDFRAELRERIANDRPCRIFLSRLGDLQLLHASRQIVGVGGRWRPYRGSPRKLGRIGARRGLLGCFLRLQGRQAIRQRPVLQPQFLDGALQLGDVCVARVGAPAWAADGEAQQSAGCAAHEKGIDVQGQPFSCGTLQRVRVARRATPGRGPTTRRSRHRPAVPAAAPPGPAPGSRPGRRKPR